MFNGGIIDQHGSSMNIAGGSKERLSEIIASHHLASLDAQITFVIVPRRN